MSFRFYELCQNKSIQNVFHCMGRKRYIKRKINHDPSLAGSRDTSPHSSATRAQSVPQALMGVNDINKFEIRVNR